MPELLNLLYFHMNFPPKSSTEQIYTIDNEGKLTQSILGNTLTNGDYRYQVTVRHDTWYAVEPMEGTQYVLFGAVVIPGNCCPPTTGIHVHILAGIRITEK